MKKIQFGISFLPDAAPNTMSAVDYFSNAIELSEIADRVGLHYVKMTEHYLQPYGGYCPNPLSFLCAVAARTQKIRLMTGCILPAFHHPLQIASEAAMADAMSGGRVDIGFARAYLPYEFEAFNVPLDESRQRYVETIETVVRLWTETNVTVEKPFFALRNATSLPRPVQQPHPPVWGAAVNSRQSFAWLGEKGFHLLVTPSVKPLDNLKDSIDIYREAFQETHGETKKVSRVAISLPLYVAETDRQAFLEGKKYVRNYFNIWANAAESWNQIQSRDYPGYTGMARSLRESSFEAMCKNGNVAIGCPDRIIEYIYWLSEKLDIDCILWQIDFGAMPGRAARRTLIALANDVLPKCSCGEQILTTTCNI